MVKIRILIQRVKRALVIAEDRNVAEIKNGLLLLVGVGREDSEEDIGRLAKKVLNLRIFEDAQGKMNLNIRQVNGQILSVPQFTLYADTRKGNRPGFDLSADPRTGEKYWKEFNDLLTSDGIEVAAGVFGAHMEVELINYGPVTIWLDSR